MQPLRRRFVLVHRADRQPEGMPLRRSAYQTALRISASMRSRIGVIGGEVLDLVRDGGIAERGHARETRHLLHDAVDVRRGLRQHGSMTVAGAA
jgi:hypothetical protein